MKLDRAFPSMVLAAYAEPFIDGRRVIVFGDCTSGLAELLLERGARLVHVYDGDLTRVAEATAHGTSKEISYAPLGQSGIGVRDGAFDFGLVDNIASFDEGAALVTRLRRALAPRGIALVATPNLEAAAPMLADPQEIKEGPGYYDLYDWVSAEFDEVRMLGQLPFTGYAVVDFGAEGEPDFALDASFSQKDPEEPDWYLALVSHFPVATDPFSIIQLPRKIVSPDVDALDQANQRVEALSRRGAQLEAEVERLRKAERAAPRNDKQERELLGSVTQELKRRDEWVEQLEAQLSEAQARIEQAETEATESEAQLNATKSELAKARDEAKRSKEDTVKLRARVELLEKEAKAAAERASAETAAAPVKVEAKPQRDDSAQKEYAALEAQLEERGREVLRLAEELRRTEKLSAELLAQIDTLKEDPRDDGELEVLRDQLRMLQRGEAQRVADLTAAQWTIQQLRGASLPVHGSSVAAVSE